VVDAGHGGWDMALLAVRACWRKNWRLRSRSASEYFWNSASASKVIYTRTDDTFVPLGRRAAIANQVGADLFISVHAKLQQQSAARGVETYYTSDGPSTQVLAEEEKEVGSAPELQMAAPSCGANPMPPGSSRQASSSPFTDPSPPRAQASATAA